MNSGVGRGAFALVVSGFVCKIFGLLFRVPLTNIVGIDGIGIFQIIMSVYSLLLVFVSSGITNALSKLVSQSRARGENLKISGFLRSAFKFGLGLSVLLGLFFALLSRQISSLQRIIGQGSSYILLILLLPLGTLIGIYRGVFQGYENMNPTAISQIFEQIIKFFLGLFFAYFLGRSGQGVFGAFLGITFSEIVAFLYLMIRGRKIIKTSPFIKVNREFFSAVLPLSLSSAIIPLSMAVEAFAIIFLLSHAGLNVHDATILYGLQSGVVATVLHFPLILSISVSVALLPKISFLSSQNDIEGQKRVISNSFGVLWFFLVPITVGIISVSRELYPLIYPNLMNENLDIVFSLTLIGGVSTIMNGISQFLIAILQGKGYFVDSAIFLSVGAVIKVFVLFSLAPISAIGVYAIVISNILLYSIISIFILIKVGKLIKVDFFEFTLPILSSAIMFMAVSILMSIFSGVVGLIISSVSGALIYFLVAFPLTIQFAKEFLGKIKFQRRNIC